MTEVTVTVSPRRVHRARRDAWQNKALVYDLLFRAAADTMLTIAADPKHLGARAGITAVLHSWGSALTHHPHVHMIVPGGGMTMPASWPFSAPWRTSRHARSSCGICRRSGKGAG